MAYRQRNKGYQIDLLFSNKRYRLQINGDEHDARQTEKQCLELLKAGNTWEETCKIIDAEKYDLTIKQLYDRTRNKFNTADKTCSNVVDDIGHDTKINSIKETTLDNLINKWQTKGNSGSTCNRKLSCLSLMLRHAHKRNFIKTMPEFEWFDEGPGRLRYFSYEEENKFINILCQSNQLLFAKLVMFAIETGMTKNELKKINTDKDLNGRYLTIYRSKNKKFRTIELTAVALQILRSLPSQPFAKITEQDFRLVWNNARKQMGLADDKEFTFHMTRHTCASRLVQKGISIQTVQAWLGHKNYKTTLRYAHLAPHNVTIAREVLDKRTHNGGTQWLGIAI
jgi:integrase